MCSSNDDVRELVIGDERYKVTKAEGFISCRSCDLQDYCKTYGKVFSAFCYLFVGAGQNFRKTEETAQ